MNPDRSLNCTHGIDSDQAVLEDVANDAMELLERGQSERFDELLVCRYYSPRLRVLGVSAFKLPQNP